MKNICLIILCLLATPLFAYNGGNLVSQKNPSYIDCHSDGIVLYPGAARVNWEELQRPDNPVQQLLDKVEANTKSEYVVVMARPESVKFFRAVRKMIAQRPIDVAYDAVAADFKVTEHLPSVREQQAVLINQKMDVFLQALQIANGSTFMGLFCWLIGAVLLVCCSPRSLVK